MTLMDELNAMNTAYDDIEDVIELKPEDEVKEPEPEQEIKEPEPAPEVQAKEEKPAEEKVEEPPIIDDVEELRKTNESLRARIEEYEAKKVEPEPQKEKEKELPPQPVDIDFLTDEDDIDDIVRDVKLFNKLLNKVYSMGVENASNRAAEGVLKTIPEVVKNNVSTFMALRSASEKFYENNADLAPFKKVVATVYEEIASEHSDWTVEQCLTETNNEARKRLELHKKAKEVEQPTKATPTLPPGSRGRRQQSKPELSKLEQEISAMNSLDD